MIVLLGSEGLLGRHLQQVFQEQGIKITPAERKVDLCNKEYLADFLSNSRPSWIINCAAFTRVDDAEKEQQTLYAVNADGPGYVAQLATKMKANLIHFSTDYVFPGTLYRPLTECDRVGPVNAYGRSKWTGEQAVRRFCSHHLILRTAWLYGQGSPIFVNTLLTQASRSKKQVRKLGIVNDHIGSPTSALALARATADIISSKVEAWGTYHAACSGGVSRYLLARQIIQEAYHLKLVKKTPQFLFPISCSDFATKAPRPKYTVLSSKKLAQTFGIKMPCWKKSLRAYLIQLQNSL